MKTEDKIKRLEDFHKAISENPLGVKVPDKKRLITIRKQLDTLKKRFDFEERRKKLPTGQNPVELARERQKNELRAEIQKELTAKIDEMVKERVAKLEKEMRMELEKEIRDKIEKEKKK